MKKLAYILASGVVAMGGMLTGCSSNNASDYDNYVEMLKAQHAIIDTISSGTSYANYIEQFTNDAVAFDSKELTLTNEQQAEIDALAKEIETALTNKYNALAQTPMTLPADFPVAE